MAKQPKPWYWGARDGWYVTVSGQRHHLGGHPAGEPKPKKSRKTSQWSPPEAVSAAFRRLLDGKPVQELPAGGDTVVAVLDDFITWVKENKAPLTAKRYEQFCQGFVQASDGGLKFGALPVSRLTSKHVTAWLNSEEGWGPTTKRNAITALKAAFNWATDNRGLENNPIRRMKKPEAGRRTDVVSPGELDEMLAMVQGPFRDLLVVSYDCGARPFEVKDLEARHVVLAGCCAMLPAEEAKGGIPRTFFFPTERSMEVVSRLCKERPAGPLFANTKGNKWTGDAVKCRFEDLEVDFGLAEMKRKGVELDVSEDAIAKVQETLNPVRKGKNGEVQKKKWELRKEARQKLIASQATKYGRRFNMYAFRRAFITRKIIAGVDSHVVAKLSGHASTAMIDRHYSQVAADHKFMLEQARRDIEPKG